MKNISHLLLAAILFFFFSGSANAQQRPVSGKGKLEYSGLFDTYYVRGPMNWTLGAGMFKYGGTVNDIFGSNFSYGFSLGGNYKVWPRTYFGADVTYLTLGAKDINSNRNITFSTWGLEFAPYCRFNIIDDVILRHQEKSSDPKFFKPYALLGVAALYYNASSTYAPVDSATALNYPAGTYKNSGAPITLAIPVGLGGSFYINPKFSVLAELVYRYTLSDMLDAAKGNPKVGNDGYISLNVKLQFTPEAKIKKKKPTFDGYLEPMSPEQKARIDSANKAKRQLLEDQIKRQQFIEDSTRIADSTQQANEQLEIQKKEEEELRKQQEEEERIRKQSEAPQKGKKKGKSSSNNGWGTPAPANKKEESSGW
ncbi:MAG: hypothetical protein K2Q22_12340 [Cytophagales bacterium]|nr:hypothetical protein [Cytophagales bacterium]